MPTSTQTQTGGAKYVTVRRSLLRIKPFSQRIIGAWKSRATRVFLIDHSTVFQTCLRRAIVLLQYYRFSLKFHSSKYKSLGNSHFIMELCYGNVCWNFPLVNCIIDIPQTNLTKEPMRSVCGHLVGSLVLHGAQIGKGRICLTWRSPWSTSCKRSAGGPSVCAVPFSRLLPSRPQQWYQVFSTPTLRLPAVIRSGRFKPSDEQLYPPTSLGSVLKILPWPDPQILCNCIFSVPGLSGCTFNFQFCFRALSFHQSEHLLKCWQTQLLCHFQSIH